MVGTICLPPSFTSMVKSRLLLLRERPEGIPALPPALPVSGNPFMLLMDRGLDAVMPCFLSDSTEGLLETEGERESLLECFVWETLMVSNGETGLVEALLVAVVMRIKNYQPVIVQSLDALCCWK